jgi:hypothetical protein
MKQNSRNILFVSIALIAMLSGLAIAQEKEAATTDEFTAELEKAEGFFDLYLDKGKGQLFLGIRSEQMEQEFIMAASMPWGMGNNDIGLDRGKLGGGQKMVFFQRFGDKVMLIQPNYGFRAESGSVDEKKAVKQAFAQSVLASFPIVAEDENGLIVDPASLLFEDLNRVTSSMQRAGQNLSLDKNRSALIFDSTKSFPENTEMTVMLTFAGDGGGRGGWRSMSVVPTSSAMTLHQRVSFIKAPDSNFELRKNNPGSAFFGLSYYDYAVPIDRSIVQRFVGRHRLEKKNPEAELSEAVEPIVYYVDRAMPEPIRSAIIEGASWWDQAFEAAGYKDAFQVKVLPEGADPLDVRYNMVMWVHRSTRGWSYGSSMSDPRTGEILKGHVSLGSLRVRQDYLIATALTSPYIDGENADPALMEMALARIRQLAAHEVGHTLGMSHSYASSPSDRASVMDYPHPYIKLDANGEIDFSDAYAVGIGEFDKVAIAYAYQDFPEAADEEAELKKILADAFDSGLMYLGDADSGVGAPHPDTSIWDGGENAADELLRMLKVRAKGLATFSENAIRNGEPYSTLEQVLVPLYYYHRYQTAAAVKTVGGLDYRYALRGDNQLVTELLPAADQMAALDAVLKTISAEVLTLPESIIEIIAPPVPGYWRDRESFPNKTGNSFDPLSAAESAAELTLGMILHPQRVNRLAEHKARDARQPGLKLVLESIFAKTWGAEFASDFSGSVQATTSLTALKQMMAAAVSGRLTPMAKAIVWDYLTVDVVAGLQAIGKGDSAKAVMARAALREIANFQDNPAEYKIEPGPTPPPGAPIG